MFPPSVICRELWDVQPAMRTTMPPRNDQTCFEGCVSERNWDVLDDGTQPGGGAQQGARIRQGMKKIDE